MHTLRDLLYVLIFRVSIIVIHLLHHCCVYLLTYMHVYLTFNPTCCAVNIFSCLVKITLLNQLLTWFAATVRQLINDLSIRHAAR